ncbi:MAG: PAN domain-containing protein [Methanotrichaceae archaeon]|nr:PAN domain-containing protein [Methanotrichaceae archaeon]
MNETFPKLRQIVALTMLMILGSVSFASAEDNTIYFADAGENPGHVYASPPVGMESSLFTRAAGNLYSFTFHPIKEKLYYCNANDNKIFRSIQSCDDPSSWLPEEIVYTHATYVRDIAFAKAPDERQRLFFSEASGSANNGKIYYLDGTATSVLYFEVPLEAVDGFWSGDFAFDDGGTLYLSSGNIKPASIYRVGRGGEVTKIFTDTAEPIKGMAYKDNAIYYGNRGKMIYRLDLSTMTKSEYRTQEGHKWISDVGFWDWTQSGCAGSAGISAEPVGVSPIGYIAQEPNPPQEGGAAGLGSASMPALYRQLEASTQAVSMEPNTNRPDWDYSNFDLGEADPNLCAQACADDPQCKAFTYVKPGYQGSNARCWLKNKASNPVPDECCVSGAKGLG